MSEIGGIGRFSKPESFVSYAGLAPKVEQSGDYTRYGYITKHIATDFPLFILPGRKPLRKLTGGDDLIFVKYDA
ncbi:MAG TPA: transposase [Candidatus Bathyarchaeia archaeon]|nr:transposase [Candidatus Bathyarchaeia archaeon]